MTLIIDDTTARASAVLFSKGKQDSYLGSFQLVGIISPDVTDEAEALYTQLNGTDKLIMHHLIDYLRFHGNRPSPENWAHVTRYHYHENAARLAAHASVFYILRMYGVENGTEIADRIIQELLDNEATNF